eukprot:360976-Chlamydomonas_euryale.AAC.1
MGSMSNAALVAGHRTAVCGVDPGGGARWRVGSHPCRTWALEPSLLWGGLLFSGPSTPCPSQATLPRTA